MILYTFFSILFFLFSIFISYNISKKIDSNPNLVTKLDVFFLFSSLITAFVIHYEYYFINSAKFMFSFFEGEKIFLIYMAIGFLWCITTFIYLIITCRIGQIIFYLIKDKPEIKHKEDKQVEILNDTYETKHNKKKSKKKKKKKEIIIHNF